MFPVCHSYRKQEENIRDIAFISLIYLDKCWVIEWVGHSTVPWNDPYAMMGAYKLQSLGEGALLAAEQWISTKGVSSATNLYGLCKHICLAEVKHY